MSFVLAIFAIGMMIIVHEGGHYVVARWSGMRVDKFSLGFGPAIVKWRHAGTQFQIAPIFFGGFVHIVGMNPHEEYDEKDPSVYPNRPTILRFLTILAGPVTNMLFATLLMFVVYGIAGVPVDTGRTVVNDVVKDKPASGVLQAGDMIVAVNGEKVPTTRFTSRVQQSYGAPMILTVLRKGATKQVIMSPGYDAENKVWVLGIHIELERTHPGLIGVVVESGKYPVLMSEQILGGLWKVVTGKASGELVSVVRMTQDVAQTVRHGWLDTFVFMAMLNVYLCLINLLPLPALDGGRLVFLSYELATRRRPNPKIEATVHIAGGVVLFLVMILVVFKDIKNLFS